MFLLNNTVDFTLILVIFMNSLSISLKVIKNFICENRTLPTNKIILSLSPQ